MNTEILQCLNMGGGNVNDISVLELQRARMMWQKEQQESYGFCCNSNDDEFSFDSVAGVRVTQAQQQLLGLVNQQNESGIQLVKPDPVVELRWPEYVNFCLNKGGPFEACGSGFELNYAVSRTNSSAPLPEGEKVGACCDGKGSISCLTEKKLSSGVGGESFKKRKSEDDKLQNSKVAAAEEVAKIKKTKGCSENVESKVKQQNIGKTNTTTTETSADTSKENSKITEAPKTDYIHVRARRGQATDSHSLAERVRREKISERMKYLQDLVPGCNKITGKAGMLDEIINYVQSLQRQVEFLSMKLAAVNPRLDFDIENVFEKEVFPACTTSYLTVGLSSDMANPSYLQFNSEQQGGCVMEMGINEVDMALRRTSSAPVSGPEAFIDTPCFNQVQQPSGWDADLHNLLSMEFHQGRSAFPSQTFTGLIEAGNLKMEM